MNTTTAPNGTNNTAPPNGTQPKATWKQRATQAKNDPESVKKITGAIIFFGAAIVEGIVLFANLSPYMKASNVLIAKALGTTKIALKPIGWIVGIAGLASVQVGEIRPLLLKNPSKEEYARASAIATIFYAIDCSLAIMFWPPLNVGFMEFVTAPVLTSINWLNILIIFITLFGAEWLVKLHHGLR
ncbi:hypothetical protein [Spirulina sp. 06S082]|uniref:hypothetical protein n=1 Tax=Spirulina sp. 06S082 TaxID=3110248 RepID=UPI002B205509|nr:hypothetical protein [Spirulina sp. 06S082]MEA5469351.1 hypothetical protein [Spirulina sp. 06S082]